MAKAKKNAGSDAEPKAAHGASSAGGKRAQQARLSRESANLEREIGTIPLIVDVDRRERCRDDLRRFCETYNPAPFYYGWSDDHLRVIARIEEVLRIGGLFAFAMPRGSGKSILCRMAALWASSYGHCRYPFLIGATGPKAKESLESVKTGIRFLPKYAEDFPEISFPAVRLGGIANRAGGQTCNGESTLIVWGKNRIVFPTVPVPENWPKHWPRNADGMVPTGGTVIGSSGLTGDGLRGSFHDLPSGECLRPDFVLPDDPQTPKSARSPVQNETRLSLIVNDLLGMAGPGKTIRALMPCTVIERGDMVDQVLDRKQHPLWRGERTKMLKSFPKNLRAWEPYFDVYQRCAQKSPADFTESNEYYLQHRAVLDDGAEAAWADRKSDREISAVQSAMHLFFRDKAGFMAEYQNDPQAEDFGSEARELIPALIARRTNGVAQHRVPRECTMLTAFFDVGIYLHFYAVFAWNGSFGGSAIDYGCWPPQPRRMFLARETQHNLRDRYPGLKNDQLVYAGLKDLVPVILARKYVNDHTGGVMTIEKAMVDSGEETAAVHKFVRASGFPAVLMASKGFGRSGTGVSVHDWPDRTDQGEKRFHYIRVKPAATDTGRTVQFDADEWKTQFAAALTVPEGGRNGITLWGNHRDNPGEHDLFAMHCAAEYSLPTALPTKGIKYDKWHEKPGKPDNHLFDCGVGAMVAAAVGGLRFSADPDVAEAPKPKPRKPVSFSEIIKRRGWAA